MPTFIHKLIDRIATLNRGLLVVVVLLGIAFAAQLFVMWVIVFRLRQHLISRSYQLIFASKLLFALLCGSGVYLILFPLQKRIVIVQAAWFADLALACLASAAGYYLYSRDVNAVLKSEYYTQTLPASTPADSRQSSKI